MLYLLYVVSVDINKQSFAYNLSIMSCESTKLSKDAIYMNECFVVALIYTVYSNSKTFVCTKLLSIKLCEST